jgi:hypothetical protein
VRHQLLLNLDKVCHMCNTLKQELKESTQMPSKNPRVNVVLDDHLFRNVQLLAEREGVSISTKVRDLVREALEIQEDLDLGSFAETRERTFKKSSALSHEETWS